MTYVVQVKMLLLQRVERDSEDADPLQELSAWVDVATVKVPGKTNRKTALRAGLEQAGVPVTPELEARLLDPKAWYVWTGKPKPDPALELS